MKDIGLDNEGYMNERVSLRKVWLIFVSKIWIFMLAVLIGALAGAGIYAAYRQMTSGTQYRAVSKLYVTFGSDDKKMPIRHITDTHGMICLRQILYVTLLMKSLEKAVLSLIQERKRLYKNM